MKKQKAVAILTVVALILLLCGCTRNTNSSNSKGNQTANIQDIAVLESGATSTMHETAKEISETSSNTASKTSKAAQSSGSSENNSAQISSQSAISSSLSSGVTTSSNEKKYYRSTERIFPEDNYSVATAPYRYDYFKSVESVADIKNFIKEIDPFTYEGGYYYSFVKLIKQNGYIPEVYYDGMSLFGEKYKSEESIMSFPNGVSAYMPTKIQLHYEKGISGVGYVIPNAQLSEEVSAEIEIYYLREEWLETAEKEPILYSLGKKNPVITSAEVANSKNWIRKVVKINNKDTVTYLSPDKQSFKYVCNGYMVDITLHGKGDYCEIAQKLSIKKVPLK